MNQRLRGEFDAITRDRSSGAAELALRACVALQECVARPAAVTRDDLLAVAEALFKAQPAMAPLLRLANEAALAADEPDPFRYLTITLQRFSFTLRTGRGHIARHFRAALKAGDQKIITTYSYSSTVLEAITHAHSRIWQVICSEGRPRLEGRATVERILRLGQGIGACLTTDAALHLFTAYSHALIVGADSIEESGFTNKAGTGALVAYALQIGRPVWVLADTTKLLPREIEALRADHHGADSEIWPSAPERVVILNPYFEKTRYAAGIRILTEKGWMTQKQIGSELRKIPVSPLLEILAKPTD